MKEFHFLKLLNEAQKKAVTYPGGPLFVIAGAGTGKTRTLTTRIAYLISKGVDPNHILAVTFTNKAANEMKQRVIQMTGPHAIDVWLHTFHAFGLRILRRHIAELPYGYDLNFTVIDEDDQKKIVSEILKELNLDIKLFSIRRLLNLIGLYKTRRIFDFEKSDEENIYNSYVKYLHKNQLVDFDDLILYPLELFTTKEHLKKYYEEYFQYILVDEFQDTDRIQYELLKILASKRKEVFVVGDPDQSIYSFRGAEYKNGYRFLKEFAAEKIVLEKNYRSTNHILESANKLISNNVFRSTEKNLESDLGLGTKPKYFQAPRDYDEAFFVTNKILELHKKGIPYHEMAIIYRNNVLSRMFEDALIKTEIPYMIYGGISFYQRKEIKDILAYIILALNTKEDFYLKRIINVPKRSIGLISLQKLEEHARDNNLSLFDAIDTLKISPKTKESMLEFKTVINEIKLGFENFKELEQILPFVLDKTKYIEDLRSKEDDSTADRIDNLKDLQTVFIRGDLFYEGTFYEKLKNQLDQIALYSDLDQKDEKDSVVLSTYHQIKGLEFKVVFMVVLEEGIFPNENVDFSTFDLEEERRVAYVGITRAKEYLFLTNAKQRVLYGSFRRNGPSRFINETLIDIEPLQIFDEFILEASFKTGDRVIHQEFGEGIVVSRQNDVVSIAFSFPHGVKKILSTHPALKKIRH